MGNRSYLCIDETRVIFEANNTLPAFWLLGLDKKELVDLCTQLTTQKQRHREQTSEESGMVEQIECDVLPAQVMVSLTNYMENLALRKAYIRQAYPKLTALYQAFFAVLQAEYEQAPLGVLSIDFLEYLNFYESYKEFIMEVEQFAQKVAVQQKSNWIYEDDVLACTIGDDTFVSHLGEKIATNEEFLALNQHFVNQQQQRKKRPFVTVSFLTRLFKN